MELKQPIAIRQRGARFVITLDGEHFSALYGSVLLDHGTRGFWRVTKSQTAESFKARDLVALQFKTFVDKFLKRNPSSTQP